jgi:trans-aconitate methyltransferase
MENFERKKHWENVYQTKELKELSWFQATPKTSLDIIHSFYLPKSAKIIDVGGGDSLLVDHLLDLGYQNLTVLDISATAIDKAKKRLGEKAKNVKWINADASTFTPAEKYDLWHDRAAFHFLTDEKEIKNYLETANQYIHPTGFLVIGTFSENGPKKCSGIEVRQYSETSITQQMKRFFKKIDCISAEHITPTGFPQHFIFCSFKKLSLT